VLSVKSFDTKGGMNIEMAKNLKKIHMIIFTCMYAKISYISMKKNSECEPCKQVHLHTFLLFLVFLCMYLCNVSFYKL